MERWTGSRCARPTNAVVCSLIDPNPQRPAGACRVCAESGSRRGTTASVGATAHSLRQVRREVPFLEQQFFRVELFDPESLPVGDDTKLNTKFTSINTSLKWSFLDGG